MQWLANFTIISSVYVFGLKNEGDVVKYQGSVVIKSNDFYLIQQFKVNIMELLALVAFVGFFFLSFYSKSWFDDVHELCQST